MVRSVGKALGQTWDTRSLAESEGTLLPDAAPGYVRHAAPGPLSSGTLSPTYPAMSPSASPLQTLVEENECIVEPPKLSPPISDAGATDVLAAAFGATYGTSGSGWDERRDSVMGFTLRQYSGSQGQLRFCSQNGGLAVGTATGVAKSEVSSSPGPPGSHGSPLDGTLRSGISVPSREEAMQYLEKHNVQAFWSRVIDKICKELPPDPFEYLQAHLPSLVVEHRQHLKRNGSTNPLHVDDVHFDDEAPELTAEQQERVVKHVVTLLQHPELLKANAEKLFAQFSKGNQLTKKGFRNIAMHLQSLWGLHPRDMSLMVDVLKRWRFRTNAAKGTRGLPLWPLSLEDFVTSYPNLLRAIRDRYQPIGGRVHRGLFIRQAAGKLTDKYEVGPRLGRGAYGVVHLVTLKTTGDRRVVKRVKQEQQRVPGEELMDEVNLLRCLDHPHIIRIFEYFVSDKHIEMIMEPVFGGTLADLIQKLYTTPAGDTLRARPDGLSEPWVAMLAAQLLGALTYAHDVVGLVHKDLKCENVLLAGVEGATAAESVRRPVHAMLTDFGIAEVFAPDPLEVLSGLTNPMESRRVGGTPSYMSPEMFKGSFTEKCDLWSFGVMMFYLMTGEFPYRATNLLMQAYAVTDPRRHPPWELLTKYRWSLGARLFCQKLLDKDEGSRPSALEASRDDWLINSRAAAGDLFHDSPEGPEERASLQVHYLQSHLMRMARHCITSQLSLTPLHQLNQRFKHYDRDGNGRLSLLEMRQVLEDIGISSSEDIDLILESLDSNRNGLIEYSEFIAGCLDLASDGTRAQLRAVFDIFDLDGSGGITMEELRQILTQGANTEGMVVASSVPGSPLNGGARAGGPIASVLPDGKTVEEVMRDLDTNDDHVVEFEEFERYLLAEHDQMARRMAEVAVAH